MIYDSRYITILYICVFVPLRTRWHCANLFQPIKCFHFLGLYRIKLAIWEYRCFSLGRNVKVRFSSHPRPQHPLRRFISYTLFIVTLLWCFNTVLYLSSCFIYYLVLLCYINYIQSECYVNVYDNVKRNFTDKPWNNVDICKLTFNWIQKYCNDVPSTACIITSNQLEWNALVLLDCDSHIRLWD